MGITISPLSKFKSGTEFTCDVLNEINFPKIFCNNEFPIMIKALQKPVAKLIFWGIFFFAMRGYTKDWVLARNPYIKYNNNINFLLIRKVKKIGLIRINRKIGLAKSSFFLLFKRSDIIPRKAQPIPSPRNNIVIIWDASRFVFFTTCIRYILPHKSPKKRMGVFKRHAYIALSQLVGQASIFLNLLFKGIL